MRGGNITMPDVQRQRAAMYIGFKIGVGAQGLQLRSEDHGALDESIIKGLFTRTISGKMKPPIRDVPQGEREHAVESLQRRLESPLRDGCEHHLGIGCAPKGVSASAELFPQSAVI